MRIGYSLKRIQDLIAAFLLAHGMKRREHWTRRQLLAFQEQRFQSLARHARRHSPFYRHLYRKFADGPLRLSDLPVIRKKDVIEHFDQIATDPRLKQTDLERYIEKVPDDDYYLGRYVVLTTAGTSGLKGLFVYDRKAWRFILASMVRASRFLGVPELRRARVSLIGAGSSHHLSHRTAAGIDVGIQKIQRLDVTLPIENIVSALNAFQPEYVKAYPSIAAFLATEQEAGHLNIHPRAILTGAEVLTEDRVRKTRDAWGIMPFNAYSATEGIAAVDCIHHRGMHLFEDLCIVEVVDEEDHPVPDGTQGFKLLVTNLYNYSQPLIRYELSDMVTAASEPCPCGRPFRRITKLAGRNDDVLFLEGPNGRPVPVHSVHFHSPLQEIKEIREYQVVQDREGLHVRVVLHEGAGQEDAAALVRDKLLGRLRLLHVTMPEVRVHFVDRIERDPARMGKIKLVKSEIGIDSGRP